MKNLYSVCVSARKFDGIYAWAITIFCSDVEDAKRLALDWLTADNDNEYTDIQISANLIPHEMVVKYMEQFCISVVT